MRPVRVLIVDDSPTMCMMIERVLRADPDIEVLGSVHDAFEARAAIKQLSPDVVTLDVEMPRMSGLEFLEKIMTLRPMPVIMVSTLTQKGGATAIKALTRGAFDCVAKPSGGDLSQAFSTLPDIVKAAGASGFGDKMRRQRAAAAAAPVAAPGASLGVFQPGNTVLAIGASTGGVDAIVNVLSRFPANCPPTVITQHMPPGFTASFASRLDGKCQPKVMEAYDGAPLKPGHIYIAPGGDSHLEVAGRAALRCQLRPGPDVSGHRPSVDVLFSSVARLGARGVGVLLTGMGSDGAAGLKKIRDAGGRTIGQDEASSIVYGMPRIGFEMGAVEQQVPLRRVADVVLELCSADRRAVA